MSPPPPSASDRADGANPASEPAHAAPDASPREKVGADGEAARKDAAETRVLASADLFGDATERRLIIRHGGREYVLFETKQGKLLLNRHG